ncbi:MFS transporter [Micromonospora sp. HUAS LYJ1]|uniref:MFS transporter n=1 Tax=Micromonospora sp. HUAS LYJ1 TaxID=3061626 RepID=UPI0026726C91|nr:MFS transporter [Micromonospora sp. HUAS LYJ1]WKU07141.1 MFS transporter [Micromonospora sp. HUAS LYJ1]
MTVTGPGAAPARALTRADVRIVVGAQVAASSAALGLPPYLPVILAGLGDPTARWAGVLYVLPTIATALSVPWWGRLADRYGCRLMLVRAQLGLAVAFWLAGQADSTLVLAVALVLQGVLGGTFAATGAYLATGLTGRDLAAALTLAQVGARLALVGGPATAGLLAGHVPPQRLYGYAALLPLVAALVTLLLPEPHGDRVRSRAQGAARPVVTLGVLCAAQAAFVFATVATYPYFLPVVARVLPTATAAATGLLFALPHIVVVVSSGMALRILRDRPKTGLLAGLALVAIGAGAHPLAVGLGSAGVLIAGQVVFGVGLTAGLVSLNLLAAALAGSRPAGRLFGTVEAWVKTGAVCAGLAASLAAVLGPAAPAAAGALVALVAAAILTGRLSCTAS